MIGEGPCPTSLDIGTSPQDDVKFWTALYFGRLGHAVSVRVFFCRPAAAQQPAEPQCLATLRPHRDRVTELLLAVATPGSSLCVLGAGNLNDLNLDRLVTKFTRFTLVDIDAVALSDGIARQPVSAELKWLAPVDLRDQSTPIPGGPFDVVLSAAVLTQMIEPGPTNADRLAQRDSHLEDLVRLSTDGGYVVLVSDVVAASTAPAIISTAPADLKDFMAEVVAAGNFFTGTNPWRIAEILERCLTVSKWVRWARVEDPWLWNVTSDRQHLTTAIVASLSRPSLHTAH